MVIALIIVYELSLKFNFIAFTLLFLSFSFYIPQIIQYAFYFFSGFLICSNVSKNSRGGIGRPYLFGSMILRLAIVTYALWCPENVVWYGTSYPLVAIGLVVWCLAQMLILSLQDSLGPRFLLPDTVHTTLIMNLD